MSDRKQIVLKRILFTSQFTGGVFCSIRDVPICLTAERPKTGEHPCIPAGDYQCHLQTHYCKDGSSYPAYQIDAVPGRTDIEIHIGNDPFTDSIGCPLVGMQFGIARGHDAVLNSQVAYDMFMDYMEGEQEFDLKIVDMGERLLT